VRVINNVARANLNKNTNCPLNKFNYENYYKGYSSDIHCFKCDVPINLVLSHMLKEIGDFGCYFGMQ